MPPAPPGPIRIAELKRAPGAAYQSRVAKQECVCPVCPPPPDVKSYTAQRKHLKNHFAKLHPEYTFLDEQTAAAAGCRSLASFLTKPPDAGACRSHPMQMYYNMICVCMFFICVSPPHLLFSLSFVLLVVFRLGSASPFVAYCRRVCFSNNSY